MKKAGRLFSTVPFFKYQFPPHLQVDISFETKAIETN